MIGRIVGSEFESFGGRKEFVVVALSFLVGCFIEYRLREQRSRRGREIKLVEAGC